MHLQWWLVDMQDAPWTRHRARADRWPSGSSALNTHVLEVTCVSRRPEDFVCVFQMLLRRTPNPIL